MLEMRSLAFHWGRNIRTAFLGSSLQLKIYQQSAETGVGSKSLLADSIRSDRFDASGCVAYFGAGRYTSVKAVYRVLSSSTRLDY